MRIISDATADKICSVCRGKNCEWPTQVFLKLTELNSSVVINVNCVFRVCYKLINSLLMKIMPSRMHRSFALVNI